MGDILPYLGVSTSYAPEDDAGRLFEVADLTGLSQKEVENILADASLTARFIGTGDVVTGQIPAPGENVPGGSQILVYLGEQPQPELVTVPDFTGMTKQQASAVQGLYIQESGNPEVDAIVTAQDIPPGTETEMGTTIRLTFTDPHARD